MLQNNMTQKYEQKLKELLSPSARACMCVCVCLHLPVLLQNSTHQTALWGPSSHNSSLRQSTPCVHSNPALAAGQNSCGDNHVGVINRNEPLLYLANHGK